MAVVTELKKKLQQQNEMIQKIRAEIGKVIIGQEQVVEQVLIAMLAGGHALLEGVPGLGKTLMVRTIAQSLELQFSRIQFTPDLMPADIIGTDIVSPDEEGRQSFQFQPGPVFGNVILADEINRATPKTQSALLEAMQEHTVTVAGKTRKLPEPFFVLATQNPLEMEGTYHLPEAQLDRFLLKIIVPFPTEEELKQIVTQTTGGTEASVVPVAKGDELIALQETVRQILVPEEVVDDAVRLLLLSHPDHPEAPELVKQYVRTGAGPRGVQALIQTAKARAFMAGRFNVAQEDLDFVALPVLRHRILRNFEGEAVGIAADQIVEALLADLRKGFEA